jgi:small subunit ribosomal protein S4|mmetsp:Transcript_71395/g.225469  ORF Transcript_71395/g.225469 Transcript_71395/m.225469 type:complete len:202 (-) Transcript_71395:578-1183(-)|eukprot:CAMPEP_0182855186 /NCGR_PEP_ID=MMETSP0034_2-20130328/1698_1 /TAXON_ID=156128 /ORGANISM="Nephroselmis pyriformis, Strain CCMP717" /LENGTH=201 /DNA_ID=CAMNT_0024986119 /DNA_START=94 /DNA_END=699 /DNA_ORIENTATION=+
MSRYRGPRLRIVRRLGELPGLTRKIARNQTRPGQHGAVDAKPSEFGIRLQEKQKLRYNYGLTERQLLRYVRQAKRTKGSTGETLLQLLEMRLDNLVFRLGMAPTIVAARQLVNHGHVTVNNQVVDIPSYACKPKEVIGVRDRKASRKLVESYVDMIASGTMPPHLTFQKDKLAGEVTGLVSRQWVNLQINELLVVEYYSRK